MTPQKEMMERVLRERANRLARRGQDEAGARELTRVMTVDVAGSRYALPLEEILEVRPFREHTFVPGAPAECLGLVNVRNELRAVVDLGLLLGQPAPGSGGFLVFPRAHVCGGRQLGLRVDAVGDVLDLDRRALKAAGDTSTGFRRGVDAEGTTLLDLQLMFSIP